MDRIPIYIAQVDGQQIEEEGPILLSVHGEQLASAAFMAHGVQSLQIRGLPGQSRSVIHEFEQDLIGTRVELNHEFPSISGE